MDEPTTDPHVSKTHPTTKKTVVYKPIKPYPLPSPVRISTISAVSFLNADIDFSTFYKRLRVVCEDDDELGVFTIKHYAKDPTSKMIVRSVRNKTCSSGDTEIHTNVHKYFQNQITIIWKFRTCTGELKTTNGFMFTNGKVKGVGLKCNEDIPLSFEALRSFLGTQLNSLGDSFQLVKTRGLDEDGSTTDVSEEILEAVRQREHLQKQIGSTYKILDGVVKHPTTPLWLYGTRATMYNTDFSANFQIIREELFRIILDDYHLEESEFEPDIYPAVKIKFAWNYDYLHTSRSQHCIPGVCYCTERCSGKGSGRGNGQCKVVTICVFGNDAPKRHDAKIIITGANSYRQVQEVYIFMNKVLRTHFEEVFYREPYMVTKNAQNGKAKG